MKDKHFKSVEHAPLLLSRRSFIVASGATLATSLMLPNWGRAILTAEKSLKLYNSHTGEWFKEIYAINGAYIPESLKKINYFLRDFRTGDETEIDPKLLDLIHRLAETVEEPKPFEIISGYRSRKTNALLRKKSRSVSANSYHIHGQAVDLRGSKSLRHLRDAARSFKAGGVGYYPKARFIHMDTRGLVRWW